MANLFCLKSMAPERIHHPIKKKIHDIFLFLINKDLFYCLHTIDYKKQQYPVVPAKRDNRVLLFSDLQITARQPDRQHRPEDLPVR